VGTQQIEKVLREYFENQKINIFRFDSDSTKTLSGKKAALADLENADIIIGTKMMTTGFDFEKIGCIGVILVESEIAYPSYNAEEKAYSSLRQIIGRGNRKSQKTNIILQSFIPKNPLIERLTVKNFRDFFTETLSERKKFSYPPYAEIVTFEYRHTEAQESLQFIERFAATLKSEDHKNIYEFLVGTNTFKKNKSYHARLIMK
jgi:primosomal protein N' (replication factor Y)